MKPRKLLLASAALSSSLACGGNKKSEPILYGNPKGSRYEDAGVEDAAPEPTPDAGTEPQAP